MHALALECIKISRERGDKCLSFSGDHFGNRAGVQDHAANKLYIIMPHAEEPSSRFTAHSKRFYKQVVKSFPC